jgi:hypothetical protein
MAMVPHEAVQQHDESVRALPDDRRERRSHLIAGPHLYG